MNQKIAVLVARDRHGRPEQDNLLAGLIAALEHRSDLQLTVIPHLYDLASEGAAVRFLRSISGDMIVLAWLYPRSAFWVLRAHGVKGRLGRTFSLPEEEPAGLAGSNADRAGVTDRTIWCLDLRAHGEAGPYLAEIRRITAIYFGTAELAEEAALKPNGKANVVDEPTRPRWYPVIDLDRCDDCKECLNFCLFGVYSLDQRGGILIEQPDACRPGCPACARICPTGAIMFPQHKDPAIAGDPKASLEGLKLDLSQLFGGADPSALAAQERDRALAGAEPAQADGLGDPLERPAKKPDLDGLIDGLDELEL